MSLHNSVLPDVYSAERTALRDERRRLLDGAAQLQRDSDLLRRSDDQEALRAHSERLARHQVDQHAYGVALHAFHLRVGPLGE